MSHSVFDAPSPFTGKARKDHIPVITVSEKEYPGWLKKQHAAVKNQAKSDNFNPKGAEILILRDNKGAPETIFAGIHAPLRLYDMAACAKEIGKSFSDEFLKTASFELKNLKGESLTKAFIGWGLEAYRFDAYKDDEAVAPALLWSKGMDKKRVQAMVQAISMLRNLVNTPANDMGPDELEKAAKTLGRDHQATVSVTKGDALEKDFPLVHMVGDSSPRRPRLIDMKWGRTGHPKVTIIGKGVCFDTGGLDIKPSQYMKLMKKDMAGAAHALGLAKLIMELNLPVRLRVLIPAVENAVSGKAFRPGDVVKSRKGLTVENTNTDAEGRLILADALTLASEGKTDLIIDFCTLTGSARAALGQDIPAIFSNNDKIAQGLQKISIKAEDPLWAMPLWQPYKRHIESPVADLLNSAGIPGDLIYSALFLESFLKGEPDWVHLDIFAWETSGRPGRAKGGCDTGLRAVFAYLEDRYG